MAYEHRSRLVFPAGFDSLPSDSIGCSAHQSCSTEQLLNVLVDQYRPLTGAELITVKTAWYGKQTVLPRHEFILVQVEDRRDKAEHGVALVNYIVLDRNVRPRSGRNTIQTRFGIGLVPADGFKISYDGKVKRLLSDCDLDPHRWLGTLEFSAGEPLHLYKLAVLANVVSAQNPRFSPVHSNCYMFAGVIWDSLCKLQPSATRRELLWKERGRNGMYHYVVAESQVQGTCDRALEEISRAESKIHDQKARFNALIQAGVAAAQEVASTTSVSERGVVKFV